MLLYYIILYLRKKDIFSTLNAKKEIFCLQLNIDTARIDVILTLYKNERVSSAVNSLKVNGEILRFARGILLFIVICSA